MTDKVQKIREELERLKEETSIGLSEHENGVEQGRMEIINAISILLDSMQEGPVAPKVLEDMLNAKTAAESLGISQEEYDRVVDELIYGKEPKLVDVDDLPNKEEEPVSEGLEEAAHRCYRPNETFMDGFKKGVKWHKEQFEKNRLAACDRQTEEEAEREQDFVMGIIENEHRKPTFDDAIKYGMRLQKEQMMKDAVLCGVDGWFINNKRNCRKNGRFHKYYESTITHDKKLPIENGKDYRLIVIKED